MAAGILGFILGVIVTVIFAFFALFGFAWTGSSSTGDDWGVWAPAVETEEGWEEEAPDEGGFFRIVDAA